MAYDPCGREFIDCVYYNLEDLPIETKREREQKRMIKTALKLCDSDTEMFIKLSELLDRKPDLMDNELFARVTRFSG